jgi:uncharacterized protein (TIGR02117 family)
VAKVRTRRLLIITAKAFAALVAIPIFYLFAALLGALIPANASWKQTDRGIRIFVETNGVHTWIVVPAVTRQMDWRPLAPASDIRDPRYDGDYLAIGYGNRDFYLNTPAWRDLTVKRALGAAFGNGRTLMHVDHERDPQPSADERPIILTEREYGRLVAFIQASFDRGPDGKTLPLRGRGYGPSDVFYEARGSYNAFYTCNEWAGEALRTAGVKVGIWTPVTQAIMRRFPAAPGAAS